MNISNVNRVYYGQISPKMAWIDGFLPIENAPHIFKRVYKGRGTVLIFPTLVDLCVSPHIHV